MINATDAGTKRAELGFIGWKSYNQIKKKAMEQEFSWVGLLVSLSIAFFVVLVTALLLRASYDSFERARQIEQAKNQKIYFLEQTKLINGNNHLELEQIMTVRANFVLS